MWPVDEPGGGVARLVGGLGALLVAGRAVLAEVVDLGGMDERLGPMRSTHALSLDRSLDTFAGAMVLHRPLLGIKVVAWSHNSARRAARPGGGGFTPAGGGVASSADT